MFYKRILILSIALFMFFACQNNTMQTADNLKAKLLNRIKDRTESDLKKYGIVYILLSDGGVWYQMPGLCFKFFKNGKALLMENGLEKGYFFWKVTDNVLYINPNNIELIQNTQKILQVFVVASRPLAYSQEELQNYKYSIIIKTKDETIYISMNLVLNKKVID